MNQVNHKSNICKETHRILRETLREVRLSKKRGQHLTRNCNVGYIFSRVLKKIGAVNCLEIGAGPGILTLFLARSVKQLITVELDLKLLKHLERNTKDLYNVHPVGGDGISIMKSGLRLDTVASNTPYYITAPLVTTFIKSPLTNALLMLQREVAERLLSPPGTRGYGRITAFVNTFAEVRKIADFSPDSFIPQPEVSSSLILIVKRHQWEEGFILYEEMLRFLFTQRKKIASKVFNNFLSRQGLKKKVDLRFLGAKRVYQLGVDDLLRLYEIVREPKV
jgi:16S rRNA (adenine1518-N6/adenine1519-N6)-dimethyltransferase